MSRIVVPCSSYFWHGASLRGFVSYLTYMLRSFFRSWNDRGNTSKCQRAADCRYHEIPDQNGQRARIKRKDRGPQAGVWLKEKGDYLRISPAPASPKNRC